MSEKTFPLIGGRILRVTVLDACGIPIWGDRVQVATDGFVSVAQTGNYDDGNEISVVNASGRRCVQRLAQPELLNLALAVTFCNVDPDIYTAITGCPRVVDRQTGDTIGFRVDRSIRPHDVSWALEVWSSATGSSGCDDGEVPYGYLVWPFLTGGKIGDYTIENNAVTFTVDAAQSKDGSGWGVGPYLVSSDSSGDPDFLADAIGPKQHQHVERTVVAPPADTFGLVPLDDPESSIATGAVAGLPGHFTPTGNVRPATLAALIAGSYTASPNTAWTTGQYVIVGDGSYAHWSSTVWVAGKA